MLFILIFSLFPIIHLFWFIIDFWLLEMSRLWCDSAGQERSDIVTLTFESICFVYSANISPQNIVDFGQRPITAYVGSKDYCSVSSCGYLIFGVSKKVYTFIGVSGVLSYLIYTNVCKDCTLKSIFVDIVMLKVNWCSNVVLGFGSGRVSSTTSFQMNG